MIGRFRQDENGNMAILFGVAFSLGVMICSIVVDGAALFHERRMLQAGVDIAALTAARDPSRGEALARAALIGAGLGDALAEGTLTVRPGRYTANPDLPPAQRFEVGALPANAVSVSVTHSGTLHFASAMAPPPDISASAIATVTPRVSFTIGSRLASLDGGIANAVLGALLGTNLSLSAMDYNRLAGVKVNALSFLDALAIEMGLDAVSYDDLLAAEAGAGQIAAALARVVNGPERGLLSTIALRGTGNSVPIGQLLDLGRYGRLHLHDETAALAADFSALDILTASAALADGDGQVRLAVTPSLPGVAKIDLDLAIGQPPQGGGFYALGPGGTIVRTSQLRLRLAVRVLAGSVVSGGVVNLPIWLDVAHAQARVLDATCPNPDFPQGTARIAVVPGILTAAIGAMNDAQLNGFGALPPANPVKLLDAALLSITGSARLTASQTVPIVLQFSPDDIAAGTLKTARTQTIASSLVTSLFANLDLRVQLDLLGIGLNLNVIAASLRALLAPLALPLDALLASLLQTLGMGLGEADVRVYGVQCSDPVLVG